MIKCILFLYILIISEVLTYPTNNIWKKNSFPLSGWQHRRNTDLSKIGTSKRTDYTSYRPRADVRRGIDIEVKVATKHPTFDILKELEKELKNISSFGDFDDNSSCTECEKEGKLKLFQREMQMKPAYPCDDWDFKSRTCWLNRNIGDTVTLVLAFSDGFSPYVQWKQEFHTLHPTQRNFYSIDSENPLWNVVIGSKGHELRLSPITEIDIDDNFFSAHVQKEKSEFVASHLKVNFRIRVMPIDQGFVYPGETLMMNMRRINLPSMSMSFKWYLESDGESSTLPSNMKLSPSGAVLTISELRKEQEGILTCSVFTNLGFFATKQRFLIKEMNQSDNLLLFVPTRPNLFNDELNDRIKRQLEDEFDDENENKEDIKDRLQENSNQNSDDQQLDSDQYPRKDPYKINKIDVYKKDPVGKNEDRHTPNDDTILNFREELKNRLNSKNGYTNHHKPKSQFTSKDKEAIKNFNHQAGEEFRAENGQIVLEVEREPAKSQINSQDEFSKLISKCQVDVECSTDATCILIDTKPSHFCRCNPGHLGNGIFCWEDIKVRSLEGISAELSELKSNLPELQEQYTEAETDIYTEQEKRE